jgi:hypothetical protein
MHARKNYLTKTRYIIHTIIYVRTLMNIPYTYTHIQYRKKILYIDTQNISTYIHTSYLHIENILLINIDTFLLTV